MFRSHHFILAVATAIAILPAMSGCQGNRDDAATEAASVASPKDAANAEHAEHGHHHAHAPWYKPRSFADLVTSLESRFQKARPSARQRAQLVDIIGWIPELAADSDLRRKDFEAAQDISKRLLDAMAKYEPNKSIPPAEELEEPLAALRDLAGRSNLIPQVEAVVPDAGQ